MSSPYFQGGSVLGPVRASPARSFREVVDALRICPVLGMAKAAFMALDKRQRNEVKQVPFFVPASFRESPSKRVYAEATHCNLIFLDIDAAKDAAPFVANPETLYSALNGLNFAAHTTASSTRENPRMRVVVEADKIPVDDYPRAVATIGLRLGITKITTESKVAVQPMFLPTLFSDSTDEDHPVIAHHFEGRAFTPADIGSNLPSAEYNSPRPPGGEHGADALDFLRAPVPEITLTIAGEALGNIPPDCSYFEWLEVAQALKHQFSPHKAEEAYALFDEWSSGGSKYSSASETRAKWDSLRQTPVGRAPITIRSLLRHAAACGWNDQKVKEACFSKLVLWMEDAESITDLMERGVKKILATPMLTAVQEDVLIHQLCTQAKKRFAYTISATAIRKDIARVKAEIKTQEKPSEKVREPLWARGVCYISAVQEFYRHRTGERYKSAAFDASYGRWLLPSEAELREAGIPVTAAALATPIISPSHYALNHLKIATVYDYAYAPSQPTEMFFVNRGRKFVNTYSPTYPELDPAGAEAAGALLMRHLKNLVAEDSYRRTLVDIMAFMVQFPGRKIRWALFMQSTEGAGKTFLAYAMRAVLGKEHVRTISGETISKGWNEWSFGKQLVVMEEVRAAGTNRHATMNVLKQVITNDDISVDQRNRDTRELENITNYMLFSNHHDALALTPGDRRYFAIKSPLQHKDQVVALGEDYFPPLFSMLRDHAGALRSFLMDWDISPGFNPDGHAPRTTYVLDMVNDSASDVAAAVRRLLVEGDYPLIQFDLVSSRALSDALQLDEGLTRVTSQQLAHVLREEGYEQCGRHLISEERHYLWARRGAGYNGTAVAIARERAARGLKNLNTDLLF